MNRFLVVPLAVFAAIALPGAAGAVTIQEFPIEPGAAPGVHAPYYVKTGPDGNLWIVDRGASAGIQRMSVSGQRLPPIATLGPPQDIAVGASGAVFWTETAVDGDPVGGKLALRLPDGSISRTGPKERANPYSVALSSDEDVWMGSQIANAASPDNGLARLCVLADDFTMPCRSDVTGAKTRYTGIAVAPGNVGWVAAFEANVVKRFRPPPPPAIIPDADLNVTLPAGSGPGRIALGPDGNLWVTMYTANAIDRITPAGERVRFPLPPGARGPNDIAAGPDGAMWFTEFDGNAIGRITMSGQITEFPVPTIASRPYGITTGPDGNIWFTENVGGAVGRLVLDRRQAGTGGGGGGSGGLSDSVAPRFTEPLDVTRSSFKRGTTSSRGTTFEFSLSEPAKVKITIERKAAAAGRRVNGKCVRRTRSNRRRSSCTRYSSVGSLTRDGREGGNAVKFSGRLNGSNLRGTYRASAVATDAAGNASQPSRVTITVRSR